MSDRKPKSAKSAKTAVTTPESRAYLNALRVHGRVKQGVDCPASSLPPGVTHVLVEQDDAPPLLIEKRKSFF